MQNGQHLLNGDSEIKLNNGESSESTGKGNDDHDFVDIYLNLVDQETSTIPKEEKAKSNDLTLHKRSKSEGIPQVFGNSPLKFSGLANPFKTNRPFSLRIEGSLPNFDQFAHAIRDVIPATPIFKPAPSPPPLPLPPSLGVQQRPGQLPPKDQIEAAKQQKEYELMIQHARKVMEKEERDRQIQLKKKEERDRRMVLTRQMWDDMLKEWDRTKNSRKVRELCLLGVPPSVRGRVWVASVHNELRVTKDLFAICGQQAAEEKKKGAHALNEKQGSVFQIRLDLGRTFPALAFYQENGPMFEQLQSVLEAYVCFRPDVGYVQGMSFLAALLLLYMDPPDAFCCLCNLLSRQILLVFYKMELEQIQVYTRAVGLLLSEKIPRLYSHFSELGILLETFLVDWILTLFSNSLPLESASRIWDIYFLQGENFLIQAIIGILFHYEEELLNGDFDFCMTFLTHIPTNVNEETLFKSIASIPISERKWTSILNTQKNKKV